VKELPAARAARQHAVAGAPWGCAVLTGWRQRWVCPGLAGACVLIGDLIPPPHLDSGISGALTSVIFLSGLADAEKCPFPRYQKFSTSIRSLSKRPSVYSSRRPSSVTLSRRPPSFTLVTVVMVSVVKLKN